MSIPPILDPTPEAIAKAVAHLRAGEIVICPSDANYGIAVDPFNPDAVASCFESKNRPGVKPLTLFVAEPGDWRRFGTADNERLIDSLASLYWPGPLNIVMDKRDGAPNLALHEDATISVACHANPVVRSLALAFGGAIAMTSANLSGMSDGVLVGVDTAVQHVGKSVSLVLRGGPVETTTSTTILRVEHTMSLLREGDLTFDQIKSDVLELQ